MDTKFLAAKTRARKSSGKSAGWFVCIALLGGLAWLAWREGFLRAVPRTPEVATLTNAIATAPTNHSAISTTLVTRAAVSTGTSGTVSRTDSAPTGNVLEAQIALDRLAISPGSIDGVLGSQTRAAIRAFQTRESLPPTGQLDVETRARLVLASPALTRYRVAPADVSRPLPLAPTWLGKSAQERLDYETLLELVSERSHAHPGLIRKLNATTDWNTLVAGTEVNVPAVARETPRVKAVLVQIRLSERVLEAFDGENKLLVHFPCSIAARVDKRPVGELHVAVIAPNPDYTFNPEIFPEVAEARELGTKLKLQPGPNNPVGTAWIGLDRPGYGIHGTPKPEDVGRTESHGCFRLANWNAEYLLQLVTVGTVVKVEP